MRTHFVVVAAVAGTLILASCGATTVTPQTTTAPAATPPTTATTEPDEATEPTTTQAPAPAPTSPATTIAPPAAQPVADYLASAAWTIADSCRITLDEYAAWVVGRAGELLDSGEFGADLRQRITADFAAGSQIASELSGRVSVSSEGGWLARLEGACGSEDMGEINEYILVAFAGAGQHSDDRPAGIAAQHIAAYGCSLDPLAGVTPACDAVIRQLGSNWPTD